MHKIAALVAQATSSEATLTEQHEAFGEIVTIFQDMAYACAFAVLRDFHLAENAAQEAFITAWQKLDQLCQPEAFPGWFRRIVLTSCNRLTRGKRLPMLSLNEGMDVASNTDPQDAIERDEMKKGVLAAIRSLPENERVVTTLFYINEHSQNDIAAFLEVPTTTVAKRLYSARNRLRDIMVEEFKNKLDEHRPSRNKEFADEVQSEILDTYVGGYRFELRPDLIVTVRREGRKLVGEAVKQKNELLANADDAFSIREFNGQVRFIRNEQGQVTHFIYYESGRELGLAKKIN